MKIAKKKVSNIISLFNQKLSGYYPPKEIRQFVYLLFEHYTGWSKTRISIDYNEYLDDSVVLHMETALTRLLAFEPIQYIIGVTSFNGIVLKVDQRVLIPRPETEELCTIILKDTAISAITGPSALDIGTGSGCIAITLKQYLPTADVFAMDNSPEALQLAMENAKSSNCDITFIHADIFLANSVNENRVFDLIVSNPPYVTENDKKSMHRNVIDFEPASALFVPDHNPLKYYKTIASFSRINLKSGGILYFEINERFGKEIRELLLNEGFICVELFTDINDKHRFIRATTE